VRNRRLVAWALWSTDGRLGAAAELLGAHRNKIRPVVEELRRAGEVAGKGRRAPLVASRDKERGSMAG